MTLPNERTNSLITTKHFLRSLLDSKKTPKVPKDIRRWAYACLRHYPHIYEINILAESNTKILEPIPTGTCHECQLKKGGKLPRNTSGITVHSGYCNSCARVDTLVPDSDYNWPKKGRKAVFD